MRSSEQQGDPQLPESGLIERVQCGAQLRMPLNSLGCSESAAGSTARMKMHAQSGRCMPPLEEQQHDLLTHLHPTPELCSNIIPAALLDPDRRRRF